jgi:hypothetical protein
MSADLETRLEEAFAARASSSSTSPDAWARINRRVARHDHRRSVVLRSVAAAAIVVLAVGGGVALFRNGGGTGTVATSGDASKSMAEDAARAPGAESGTTPEVQVGRAADGSVFADAGVPDGPRVSTDEASLQSILVARTDRTLVGLVPPETQYVRFDAGTGPGSSVFGTVGAAGDPALGARGFVFAIPASVQGTLQLSAVDSAGQVVGTLVVSTEDR